MINFALCDDNASILATLKEMLEKIFLKHALIVINIKWVSISIIFILEVHQLSTTKQHT